MFIITKVDLEIFKIVFFFFSSRRRHTRFDCDWSSDVCSSDLILSTLPSAGVGALLALTVTGYDLSLVSFIGIILLMGIVKKNAIMMIDFALEIGRASCRERV